MALNSSFLLLLFFNQKKSSEWRDYSKQPLGKGTCWESCRRILQSTLRLNAKGWGTHGKNQIACDPPLIAAPLLEWCHEEKKIFPPLKTLMRILESLMRSWVGMTNVSLGESKPGSRENLSTPRGNLQPAADTFMGKNLSGKRQNLPLNTQRVNLEACEQEMTFFPSCIHAAKNQNLGLVIVWCKNSRAEVWVSWCLAQHVHLMWIKGYMVELSKYNQCNMIHSCPAQQMLEQMSGKKIKICWGVRGLFWMSAFKRREYLY